MQRMVRPNWKNKANLKSDTAIRVPPRHIEIVIKISGSPDSDVNSREYTSWDIKLGYKVY